MLTEFQQQTLVEMKTAMAKGLPIFLPQPYLRSKWHETMYLQYLASGISNKIVTIEPKRQLSTIHSKLSDKSFVLDFETDDLRRWPVRADELAWTDEYGWPISSPDFIISTGGPKRILCDQLKVPSAIEETITRMVAARLLPDPTAVTTDMWKLVHRVAPANFRSVVARLERVSRSSRLALATSCLRKRQRG